MGGKVGIDWFFFKRQPNRKVNEGILSPFPAKRHREATTRVRPCQNLLNPKP